MEKIFAILLFVKPISHTEYKIMVNIVYVDKTSKFSFCKSFTVILKAETGHHNQVKAP